jgi:hypothetical protein
VLVEDWCQQPDPATRQPRAAATPTSERVINGSGPLRFGGDEVWAEWFDGRIDEVRVYDRALSQTELQTDMTTPITAG